MLTKRTLEKSYSVIFAVVNIILLKNIHNTDFLKLKYRWARHNDISNRFTLPTAPMISPRLVSLYPSWHEQICSHWPQHLSTNIS